MLNGLTIHHKGKSYDIDLTEQDADHISDLTAVIEHAPRDPEPLVWPASHLTPEQQAEHKAHYAKHEQVSADFQKQLKRLANLDEYKMGYLLAFLDLIELGDLDGSQSNWGLEFMERVLHLVIRYGAAGALHQDPRGMLGDLSHYLYNYWAWVRDRRDVLKQHPEIFPAPPAEPEAAPEPEPSTTRPPRRRHARKARRKAA